MISLYEVSNEGDLHELLESYNEAGDVKGLVLPSRDSAGNPFLSSLADDGDSTHVEYITVEGDSGYAVCSVPDCPRYDSTSWNPIYPITVMTENPVRVI